MTSYICMKTLERFENTCFQHMERPSVCLRLLQGAFYLNVKQKLDTAQNGAIKQSPNLM